MKNRIELLKTLINQTIANTETGETRVILDITESDHHSTLAVTADADGLRDNVEFCSEKHEGCESKWLLTPESFEFFKQQADALVDDKQKRMRSKQHAFFERVRQFVMEGAYDTGVYRTGGPSDRRGTWTIDHFPSPALSRTVEKFPIGSYIELKDELLAKPRFFLPGDIALVTGVYMDQGLVQLSVIVTDSDADTVMPGQIEVWRVKPYVHKE